MIRRQVLDVAVNGTEAEGFALQGKLVALCGDWLTSALDEAFARLSPGDEHWSIDRLDIDAGSFTLNSLERDFVGAVRTAVERQMRERSSGLGGTVRRGGLELPGTDDPPIRRAALRPPVAPHEGDGDIEFLRRTDAQAAQDAFVHFLATGVLPWWFRLPPNETLEAYVSAAWGLAGDPASSVASTKRVIASSTARLRLVRQFSTPFLEVLLQGLSPETARAAQAITAQLKRQPSTPEILQRLWLSAFEALSSRRPVSVESLFAHWSRASHADAVAAQSEHPIIADVARALSLPMPEAPSKDRPEFQAAPAHRPISARRVEATLPTMADRRRPAESAPAIDLDEGVFVDCAGVVLLHPFLPAIFERLGVASAGGLILPDRALALLHFLATGETRAPEYALLLPKLLCGLPLEEPVGPPVELTEGEIAEAGKLLAAVIGHWDALGDTSPDALRGTFLVRPGKLSHRDSDDLLQVEPQSFDVLLDRLPWGIGATRLPWMERMLWVEWRM
jgi:hypothetical protein